MLKKNIFRVAASSDLIGNPYNFVNTLGRSVSSAYYEPKEGFMKGPLQGGLGVLKGTAGIVSVTGAGVAGSIGKATNAINKALV
jgi:vacuolar protein sorting-associated protein 13A/C